MSKPDDRLRELLSQALYMLGVLSPDKGAGGTIGFHPDSWQARRVKATKERIRNALADSADTPTPLAASEAKP